MFGWLRFFLACCVALAHAGVAGPGGHHIGVPAVVVFYLISGYVVSAQWHALRRDGLGLPVFYRDRALRVLPLYYVVLGATALYVGLAARSGEFTSRAWDAACWTANLLVVPLDWFPYTGVEKCTYVPPAWSLGLEMQFYLLAPALLLHRAVRDAALWLSVAVYAAASWNLVPTEIYGYRLLPGTLFMFLAGGAIEEARRGAGFAAARLGRHWVVLWLAVAALGAAAWAEGLLAARFTLETLIGFLVGLPMVALAARWRRRDWDDWLAGVSYPLFLCHFVVIWAFQDFGVPLSADKPLTLLAYLAALMTVSALLWHACDEPSARWRRRLRRQSVTAITAGAQAAVL